MFVFISIFSRNKELMMKSKQIKHGHWKDAIVHFNGVMSKVIGFDGIDKFKIHIDGTSLPVWVHKSLIVWS